MGLLRRREPRPDPLMAMLSEMTSRPTLYGRPGCWLDYSGGTITVNVTELAMLPEDERCAVAEHAAELIQRAAEDPDAVLRALWAKTT